MVIHEDHAAFFTGNVTGQKRFGNMRQQIHDGIADANEIKQL
jgi:hypothetical protein